MIHAKIATIICNFVMICDGAIIPLNNREGKLSLVEWTNYNYYEPEGYGTYAFGYDVEDPETNNIQFRNEEKLANGSVVGSYGYLEETGSAFVVRYIADKRGYRATIDNPTKLSFLKPFHQNHLSEDLKSIKNLSNNREVNYTEDHNKDFKSHAETGMSNHFEERKNPSENRRAGVASEKSGNAQFNETQNNTISNNDQNRDGLTDRNSVSNTHRIENDTNHSMNVNSKQSQIKTRIVTPEGTSSQVHPSNTNSHKTNEQIDSDKDGNSSYYPQNILQGLDFANQDKQEQKKPTTGNSQATYQQFGSNNESNYFYYPQNILKTPDFHQNVRPDDKITFQKKIEESNQATHEHQTRTSESYENNSQIQMVSSAIFNRTEESKGETKSFYFDYPYNILGRSNELDDSMERTKFNNGGEVFKRKKSVEALKFGESKNQSFAQNSSTSTDISNEFASQKFYYHKKHDSSNLIQLEEQLNTQFENNHKTGRGARIYTPEENLIPAEPQVSPPCLGVKDNNRNRGNEDNSFYYPQNILEIIDSTSDRNIYRNEFTVKKDKENDQTELRVKSKYNTRIVTPDNHYLPSVSNPTSSPCS